MPNTNFINLPSTTKLIMKVAILYSGGKDSTLAIELAMQKGWEISYLLSVKPNRTDCFLYHYATVEHTKEIAKILNLKHILVKCKVADPKKEAEIVKDVVEKNPVDAVILGGTGLQVTQIKSIQEALLPLGVEAFPSHAEHDHDTLLKEMVEKGYKIMITQIASDGLNETWLGRTLDEDSLRDLFQRSQIFGFPAGMDGGYADTFIIYAPFFGDKEIKVLKAKRIMESSNTGHLEIKKLEVLDKKKEIIQFE